MARQSSPPDRPKPRRQTREKNMTESRIRFPEPVDLIDIERQARAMQAQVMADGIRAMFGWLRSRLSRQPGARTA
jgi:hypothetical protein